MSQPQPAGGPLPLLYHRPEVLDAARHARLGLRPQTDWSFAAAANAVPLTLSEFARAAVSFPIVFAVGRQSLSPVAVTGLRGGQNLFVRPDGAWEPDAHVPAYLRRVPFILTRPDDGTDEVLLCLDLDSPRVAPDVTAEDAAPLFADGAPTDHARRAMDFCLDYQRHAMATDAVVTALREAGVLVLREGKVDLAGGETLTLTDFEVVDEAALNALPPDRFLALREAGALPAAWCQMISMQCWGRLTRLAEARRG